MKAIFLVGVSGSGKSYWAKQNAGDSVIIERDIIRKCLIADHSYIQDKTNMWLYWKFNKENEQKVTDIVDLAIELAASHKKDIIFSNTNLNYSRLQQNICKMKLLGYEVEVKGFPCDFDEVVKRDRNRVNSVGYQVICKQWMHWLKLPEEITSNRKYIKDPSKPKAILVDIDGTVCKFTNRTPYEYDKVLFDDPIVDIIHLVNNYKDTHTIIFLSGRDSVCRQDTFTWLTRYFNIQEHQLLMRPEGNTTKDRIIKEQLFWNHVAPNYCVDLVIDDRKQVIRLWTDISSIHNSFTLINVGNYYDDF